MQVNVSEALRYLGYRGKKAEDSVLDCINSCAQELMRGSGSPPNRPKDRADMGGRRVTVSG